MGVGKGGNTSIMWVCPFTPALRWVLEIETSRSRPRRFEGTGMVMSRSPIVWAHLYGSWACSAASLARASASFFSRCSGVGEVDIFRVWDSMELDVKCEGVSAMSLLLLKLSDPEIDSAALSGLTSASVSRACAAKQLNMHQSDQDMSDRLAPSLYRKFQRSVCLTFSRSAISLQDIMNILI